jgi:5-methylthioadenosine/S-adenosylhomocysteine deaminase
MKSIRGRVRVAVAVCLLLGALSYSRATSAQSRQPADLLITAKHIVTMDSSRRVLDDAAIAVRDGKILAIGPRAEIEPKFSAARTLNVRDKLVMPGFINGHTHAAMSLLRGIADDVTLQDWLQKFIFPAEARNVTEDFVTWGTRLGVLEMLKSGTTTYADMYYFEDSVARETKAAGMRGVLGETLIDFPAPDNKTIPQALSYTEDFLKRWRGDPLIHAAAAPHSIYTCSEKTLKDAAALARKYQAPILIHVSETKKELDDSRAAHNGESPVAYLNRIGILGPDVLAAHCIWVDAADIALLAKSRTGCAHNPSSNMMLASGVAPIGQMLKAGLAVGLGTDGAAGSNNDLDMMEEMDLAAKLQKISQKDPQALGAQQAIEMATIRGAQALHMENEIGSLEVGKDADLLVLNLDAPNAVPLYNLYSQIVYALKASDVEDVVVNGRVVMLNRHVLTLNEPEIIAHAREIAAHVKQSLAQH